MAAVAQQASAEVVDKLEERLQECRTTFKLNVGYAGMPQLPAGFIQLVLQYNPNLAELDLSSNNLKDLPDDFNELQQLRILRIKYNQLARIPAAVLRLSQLLTLELSGNQIVKLDSAIAKMTNLRELDISGNLLTELPQSLAMLPKLEVLRLENNRLEALPENFGELHSLIKLDISTNCLRQLPASMGRLKRIQRIDAANNVLTRVPPSMGHLKSIKELNLKYNSLDDRYKAKAEEGLSRLLAFLREEEERERLEEIERLRPIGTAVGPYMEYRCKAEPSQVLKTEFGEFNVDNRCWIRHGFSLTQVNNTVFVFGGQLVKDGSVSNELFWMTSERMEWHLQPTRGDRPVGRYGHVAVYDPDHHQLVVFGGRNADKRRLGDVAVLDLDSFTWRRPAVSGTAPSPREGAAAVYHAGHMALFGGHASGGRTNDLLLLELSGWVWSQPATTGTAPSPRSSAAMCVGHGRYLVVHGGRNNFVLDTAHVLDLMTRTWVEVSAVGAGPPPRHGHLVHVHNDLLYLFGGLNDLGVATVSLFKAVLPRQQVDRACALANAAAFGESAGAASAGGVGADDAASQQGAGANGAGSVGSSAAAAMLQLEWQELEAQLPFNKSRANVMQQGQLRCYQLGSATLGRSMNEDDAEKGLAYWDVFKTAQLEAFKPKPQAASGADSSSNAGLQRFTASSSKASRVQHATHSAGKLPPSITSNTPKEQKLLAYVADFQRVFQEFYPHRRPVPLTPANECGIPKFICTTLRPSLPPCPELYNLEGCATFVAEFLAYEPLSDPLHPPSHFPSPMSILQWQTADAFDASMVLCSLLLGAGYNAFVVMGYAPLAVTLNDQSQVECPLLNTQQQGAWWAAPGGSASAAGAAKGQAAAAAAQASSSSGTGNARSSTGPADGSSNSSSTPGGISSTDSTQGGSSSTAAGSKPGAAAAAAAGANAAAAGAAADEPGKRKKYQVRPKPELASRFLQQHPSDNSSRFNSEDGKAPPEEAAAQAAASMSELSLTGHGAGDAAAQAAAAEPSSSLGEVQPGPERRTDNRVHAWVLVLPGKREVTRPVFVEPSTGRLVSPSDPSCPYTGVELLWNASNAWICMQAPEPHSDSRAAPASINWDLSNTSLWEAVVDERQTRPTRTDGSPDNRSGSALVGTVSRAGLSTSMVNTNSGLAIGSAVGGRPHTPTLSTINLQRTATSATAGLMPSSGGIAAQLSRVASRVQVGAATGTGSAGSTAAGAAAGAAPGTPGRPESSHRPTGGGSVEAAAAAGPAASTIGAHTARGPPSEYARSEYARSEIGDGSAVGSSGAGDEVGPEYDLLPDLPPSWVPKLAVSQDMMDMRCPRGSRTTVYKRCTHEIFAPFGECARWDGLVERVTRFTDEARHEVEEVVETFARRKDKLRERRSLPLQHTVHEFFGHGSLFSVKELRIVRGERREIQFYAAARLDSLVRREEIFGVKLTEHFAGRDDFLTYRSAMFGAAASAAAPAAGPAASAAGPADAGLSANPLGSQPVQSAAGYGLGTEGQQQQVRATPVVKITQKFARNTAKPADADLAKQVFYLAAGKTVVHFHHADDCLTAGQLVFHKEGPAQAVQVDPLAPHPSGRDLLEMYRLLQGAEKDVLQAVRDSEWEGREIARTRSSQEQTISLDTPYYDICRIQANDSDDEPPDGEASAHDYLLPFLPPGMALAGGAGSLTREQALAVRERCLRALKDRLIERANIIQARLDEEQATLARRQASYARDRDSLTPAEEEEHEKAVEESGFRSSILQKRLARHEETALQQYYQLDRRLRSDPRLSVLLKPM